MTTLKPCDSVDFEPLLSIIISHPLLHGKWLNTLSYLENCGARKIAGCEHPTKVKREMLKHASEEFRHAYHLKQQIVKVWPSGFETYNTDSILGKIKSLHYLQSLDIQTCRYLKIAMGIDSSNKIKLYSYLLVTYAIEIRASQLYPLYHQYLKKSSSKVSVKSIILEEEEHLNEMRREIDLLPQGDSLSQYVCLLENQIFEDWKLALKQNIYLEVK